MATGLNYQIELFGAAQPDLARLCVRHWEEIALNKGAIALDPDWDRYAQLEALGALVLATARAAGELVGYQIFLVTPHLHYRRSLTALSDVVYLAPEHRLGTAGIRLMRCAEAELKRRGVQRVVQNVKLHTDWGRVLERMGYAPIERIYSKLLEA